MGKGKTVVKVKSVSFVGLLTILFIGLKLTGFINWSWVWVLAPMWIGLALGLAVFVFMAVALMVAYLVSSK